MMSNWTAASSDCSRPANNYVRVNTVDLYTPNARFTPERLGYQVFTLFGKLGYSQFLISPSRIWFARMGVSLGLRSRLPAWPLSPTATGPGITEPARATPAPP